MILRAPPGGEGSGHYDGSHWPPPLGEYCGRYKKLVMHTAVLFRVFSLSTRFSAGRGDVKVPNNNRGMTYQSNGKELTAAVTTAQILQ